MVRQPLVSLECKETRRGYQHNKQCFTLRGTNTTEHTLARQDGIESRLQASVLVRAHRCVVHLQT
jgi:hypothetical protein